VGLLCLGMGELQGSHRPSTGASSEVRKGPLMLRFKCGTAGVETVDRNTPLTSNSKPATIGITVVNTEIGSDGRR